MTTCFQCKEQHGCVGDQMGGCYSSCRRAPNLHNCLWSVISVLTGMLHGASSACRSKPMVFVTSCAKQLMTGIWLAPYSTRDPDSIPPLVQLNPSLEYCLKLGKWGGGNRKSCMPTAAIQRKHAIVPKVKSGRQLSNSQAWDGEYFSRASDVTVLFTTL